ncbi:MAG: GspH/FimT family pseudopilin [Pseudomonas sp.]
MCTVGTESRGRGFTLLELLVVLVIASLAISLVGPAFQRLMPGLTLEAESRKLVAMLRHARSQAILTGTEVTVSQDAESGGLRLSYREQPYILPERLSLVLEAGPAQGETAAGVTQILFYPRGDSSGGSLELKMEARSEVISVDWLSGRVRRGAVETEEEAANARKKARAQKQDEDEGEADDE